MALKFGSGFKKGHKMEEKSHFRVVYGQPKSLKIAIFAGFWGFGQNGQKGPKMAKNGPKWPFFIEKTRFSVWRRYRGGWSK